MALRSLLGLIEDDPAATALAREGGHAFVSASLRPYLIAALADRDPRTGIARTRRWSWSATTAPRATWRPICARGSRPRRVRYYPSRGVAYESHLAPPPHLVGLRVAALDALLNAHASDEEPPVVVVSAVALSEKVPDPALRPRSFTLRVGELLDLDECAAELVAAGYERVDQVAERGQFALRGGLLDVFPATEDRAVRVDMFDVEIESLRWFSTFTQRSLGDVAEVEIAPAAELALEHRELAEMAASEERGRPPGHRRAAAGRALRRAARPARRRHRAARRRRGGARARARRPLDRRVRGVRRRGRPPPVCEPDDIESALAGRARIWLSAISGEQPLQLRAQAADTAARSLAEAEPELEKLVRSGYRTVVAFPRRGEGERAAYNLGRMKASWLGEDVDAGRQVLEPSLRFAAASLREGFVAPQLKLAVFPEHRLLRRRRAERPARDAGRGRTRRPGRRAPRGAALVHRAAHGRHRRARGSRRRAVRGL